MVGAPSESVHIVNYTCLRAGMSNYGGSPIDQACRSTMRLQIRHVGFDSKFFVNSFLCFALQEHSYCLQVFNVLTMGKIRGSNSLRINRKEKLIHLNSNH